MKKFEGIDDPRRRMLVDMLTLSAVLTARPGAVLAQGLFGDRRLPEGRSIYSLRGTVTVNDEPATKQSVIGPGDVIVTGANSVVIFAVDGRAMIVRSDSRLEIDGEPSVASRIISGLRLLTGRVLSVSRKSPIALRTSVATIGIRGTGWYAESDPEQTYFCTCYGETDIAANSDPNNRITVAASHHDRPVYILGSAAAGRGIRDAPFINHTDDELALIESLVGRTPPFVFPSDDYSGPRRDY